MEKEDNFQTLNMIYKIEKIKKRKQKKYPKKMDMFDTLENPSTTIEKSILYGKQAINAIIEPFDQNSSSEKTKIIEALTNSDFDQLEPITRNIIDPKKMGGDKDRLKDTINYVYEKITSLNRHMAIFIAIAASGKPPEGVGSIDSERLWWGLPKESKEDWQKEKDKEKDKENFVEGYSWDSDLKDSTDSGKGVNLDYKLEAEAELENKTKDDEFSKTEQYAKDAMNKLLSGETIDGPASPQDIDICLLYTSPSPRDRTRSRMPSSA